MAVAAPEAAIVVVEVFSLMLPVRALLIFSLPFAAFLFCGQAEGGQSLHNGFYSHEPAGVTLSISNANLGRVCGTTREEARVCTTQTKIRIEGDTTCTASDGTEHLCTRYGYQYDYQGAIPGSTIRCEMTRFDGFNERNFSYTLTLDGESGHIFQPAWLAYQPVERRVMLSEVHECSYQDELLASIEFIVTYEPVTSSPLPTVADESGPSPGIDEPYIDAIPDACSYLTDVTAARIMQVDRVQEGFANEHIDDLWSQCTYTSIGAPIKEVGFVFKFMLYEMFDVENLHPMQLRFNVTFAAGGREPTQTLDDPGKRSWVFHDGDQTILLVITGIQGPPDGAGRPREFIANYFLDDPERSHASRLEILLEYARKHLDEWHGRD